MKRIAILSLLLLLIGGCEQQVISRHDSLSDRFAQINRQGWSVDDPNRPAHAASSGDPNVRVIRSADFSSLQFHTNFQLTNPGSQPPEPASNSVPASAQPAVDPWSVGLPSGGH